MRRYMRLAVVLLLVVMLSACAGDGETTTLIQQDCSDMLSSMLAGDIQAAVKVMPEAAAAMGTEDFQTAFDGLCRIVQDVEEFTLKPVGWSTNVKNGVTTRTVDFWMDTDEGRFLVRGVHKEGYEGLYHFVIDAPEAIVSYTGTLDTMKGADWLQWAMLLVTAGSIALVVLAVIDCSKRDINRKALWIVLIVCCGFLIRWIHTTHNHRLVVNLGLLVTKYSHLVRYADGGVEFYLMLPLGAMVYFLMRKRITQKPTVRSQPNTLRVMSFNTQHCLNFLERTIDYPLMAKTITDCCADIVGLNEMRGLGSAAGYEVDQTMELAKLTGMHGYFAQAIGHDGVKPYGNGLLSRLPIVQAQTIPIPDPAEKTGSKHYETRCLLKARLEGGLTVLVVHMGLNTDEQANAVETILQHLPEEKCVLMGDFNAQPEDPVLAPLFGKLKDASALFREPKLTWPSDAPTAKLDYILVTPDITLCQADVPNVVASDHRPHTALIYCAGKEKKQ